MPAPAAGHPGIDESVNLPVASSFIAERDDACRRFGVRRRTGRLARHVPGDVERAVDAAVVGRLGQRLDFQRAADAIEIEVRTVPRAAYEIVVAVERELRGRSGGDRAPLRRTTRSAVPCRESPLPRR